MRQFALLSLCLTALSGCAVVIDQASFFPRTAPAPSDTLRAPAGYAVDDRMIELPGLGRVHAVRLDNPASDTTILYAGGNMSFVAASTPRVAAIAEATGADIIVYDYPGRGGTDVPATMDAAIAFGPAFMAALREIGWIGRGPLFIHGLSFGGSQAASLAREAQAAGLIIENSAADIGAVGRNFVPWLAKPFVKLWVDPELARFDYLGYAVAAKAPVLLIVSEGDRIVRPRNMADFADQLRARGVAVTSITVPGPHGRALQHREALSALRAFTATHGGR